MVEVRIESPEDRQAIYQVNVAAFGRKAEARLVDELRKSAKPFLSFVAHQNGKIVGHVSYSPVLIGASGSGLGLAPIAVLPRFQRQGIGTVLLSASLQCLHRQGYPWVVVLGHPAFYSRFGFLPSQQHEITCEYDVPSDLFMVQELIRGSLAGIVGVARYHSAFASL